MEQADAETVLRLRPTPPVPLADDAELLRVLERCPEGCDLLITLLAAALLSGRVASTLTDEAWPSGVYPCAVGAEPDYEALAVAVGALPAIDALIGALRTPGAAPPEAQRRLLRWVLAPRPTALPLPAAVGGGPAPTFHFALQGPRHRGFDAAGARGSSPGYHGSACKNMHSILRNGLRNYSGTTAESHGAILGDGVYFSADLGLASRSFAPASSVERPWARSMLPGSVSVCIVADIASGGASVHDGVLVVNQDQDIAIRSLLVFSAVTSAEAEMQESQEDARVSSGTVICVFAILLMLLNPAVQRYLKSFLQSQLNKT